MIEDTLRDLSEFCKGIEHCEECIIQDSCRSYNSDHTLVYFCSKALSEIRVMNDYNEKERMTRAG